MCMHLHMHMCMCMERFRHERERRHLRGGGHLLHVSEGLGFPFSAGPAFQKLMQDGCVINYARFESG